MKTILLAMVALSPILSLFAGTRAQWLKLELKQKYRIQSSASEMRLSEFALYDSSGAQCVLNLTAVAETDDPSEMAPGTCFVSCPYTCSTDGVKYLFDGAYVGSDTKSLEVSGIATEGSYAVMSIDDESTWTTVVLRVPEGTPAIENYQLFVGYYNWSGTERSASRWTLSASYDGLSWFELDDQTEADVTSPASNQSPYNGGTPFDLVPETPIVVELDVQDDTALECGYGDDAIVCKSGDATLTVRNRPFGEAQLIVESGTVAFSGAAFRFYRFKIEDIIGTSSPSMEISEFKLLKDGEDVTAGFTSVSNCSTEAGGGGSPSGEGPAKAVDGNLSTKFLDRSVGYDKTAEMRDKCWLLLEYSEPRAIDGYNWASGCNNCWKGVDSRTPSAWRLQGSDDGVVWYDLDVQTKCTFTPTFSVSTWQSDSGFSSSAASFGGLVRVKSDSTLSIAGNVTGASVVNNGTVSGSAGSVLEMAPAAGMTEFLVGGGIGGSLALAKNGAGTLEVDGNNSFAGSVEANSGILRFGKIQSTPAKWFRLSIKQKYSWVKSSVSNLALGEFGLFDSDKVQQNAGLKVCGGSVSSSRMPKGSIQMRPNDYEVSDSNPIANFVDGNTSTKMSINNLPVTESGYSAITPDDESTWIVFVLRLSDEAHAITGYNLFVGDQNWEGTERSPSKWTLEASYDGDSWFVIDDRTAAEVTNPGGPSRWYNYTAEVPLTPFGLTSIASSATAALPIGSCLSVAAGATVQICDASTVGALKVDCSAGAGTLAGLAAAANGSLYLTNASGYTMGTALPITLSNVGDVTALRGWKVFFDGVEQVGKVSVVDGQLVVNNVSPTLLLLR